MKIVYKYLIPFLLLGVFVSCKDKSDNPSLPTFSDYVKSETDLSMFASAIDKARLQIFKDGPGPFTWFAPTNDAFTAAGITTDSLNKMKPGDLSYILLYHMVNASFASNEMVAQNSFPRTTQMGAPVYIGKRENDFFINGSKITSINKAVSNGFVHKINRINIPPNLAGNLQVILTKTGQHSLFIQALTKANRWAGLASTSVFTVLAPTDDAMNAAGLTSAAITAATVGRVDSLVRYHYFNSVRLFSNDFGSNQQTPQTALGTGRTITSLENGAKLKGKTNTNPVSVSIKNLHGVNGVVHVIDGVLSY
jgi:uncharacterized surface protein with fasciclin (FAS1) repeats